MLYGACEKLVIPAGVAQEIDQGPENDHARSWLQSQGSSWVKKVDQVDPIIAAWDLGLGESQVISWAYRNAGYEVILDDRDALVEIGFRIDPKLLTAALQLAGE